MAVKKLKVALSEAANTADGISASGTVPITYADTVWEDMRIIPSAFDFAGSADPNLISWQPAGSGTTFKAWEFTTSDEAFVLVQMPHSYKVGSDVYIHIHWTPHSRGTAESGKTVKWAVDYSWANIGSAFGASAKIALTDTCTGTNHLHEMTPTSAIAGATKGISSMLILRIFRDTGDSWATNTANNNPILLEVDLHYELDTAGSSTETAK
jgi:hypothetical protein